MGSGIFGIDHVVLAVRDLERARMRWTRLGFALSPRGRHIGHSTANYCIMFADDYLELLGVVTAPDEFSRHVEAFLARREGPMALGLALAEPIESVHAALLARGLHPGKPRALARQLELPEETVVLRFTRVTLPPEETPGLDCFLCAHLTPEPVRQRGEWLQHPNGAAAVRAVHVLVETTLPLLAAYDRLFGLPQVTTTDAVARLDIGRHRIVFSTVDDFLTMHPGVELDADPAVPGIVALDLAVRSRQETADYLAQWQVDFDEMPDGRLAVPGREADGALLFFSEG
jgi:catechol 2,3-dioxygenase-like lactoylglutathione lyase family enzyme